MITRLRVAVPAVVLLALGLSAFSALADQTPCAPTVDSQPISTATQESTIKSVLAKIPVFGVDLVVGSYTGVMPSVYLLKDKNINVAIEGFAGAAALNQAYGGGMRFEWHAIQGKKNALVLAPGVDVFYSGQIDIAPSLDVKWLHQFGQRVAFELGARAGTSTTTSTANGAGSTDPTFELLTGLRF